MQLNENVVSDYVTAFPQLVNHEERQHVVLLIEDLHKLKKYKPLTLYASISLADRYLTHVLSLEQEAPCLVTLATTCLLLGAKIEESIAPSTIVMI